MPKLYGLIGYPLTHSFSPDHFNAIFRDEDIYAEYRSFPILTIKEYPTLLTANPRLKGLNVTIPYKEAVMPYLNDIDSIARVTGAVNCIDIRDGVTTGYNTDVVGFEKSLIPLLQPHHTRALVLGTGGAAKAVIYVLRKLGIAHTEVSRSSALELLTYRDLTPTIMAEHTMVINTTPSGMYPNIDAFPPLPYEALTDKHLLYDLIYNPMETKFLAQGKAQGAQIKNGMEMLVLQADACREIWGV